MFKRKLKNRKKSIFFKNVFTIQMSLKVSDKLMIKKIINDITDNRFGHKDKLG